MTTIVIIGGGFAGVWAAAGVKRLERDAGSGTPTLQVVLVDGSDDMVIRPRLYEDDPQAYRVPLDRILGPIGVRRVAATVTGIDTATKQILAIGRSGQPSTLDYDRLVLAAGSRTVPPPVRGAEHVFNVDQVADAADLHGHLHRLPARHDGPGRYRAVVIGAGFTGLEVATELVGRLTAIAGDRTQVHVTLVERAPVIGPELGPGPRPEITTALGELGVDVRVGSSVDEVTPDGVRLADGSHVPAATVVWTGGMLASHLTTQIPGGRDRLGRLIVDEHLRVVGVPDVFAAGDTAAALAEPGHHVMQSCQHAVPQGKFVGHNVAADVLGRPLVAFAPDPYVTCLDLGPWGAVLTSGWDRDVQLTRDEAKDLKRNINTKWIYPPLDDAELILDHADWRTTWPTAEVSGQPSTR